MLIKYFPIHLTYSACDVNVLLNDTWEQWKFQCGKARNLLSIYYSHSKLLQLAHFHFWSTRNESLASSSCIWNSKIEKLKDGRSSKKIFDVMLKLKWIAFMLDFTCYLNSTLWRSTLKIKRGCEHLTSRASVFPSNEIEFCKIFILRKYILGSLILHCIHQLEYVLLPCISCNLPSGIPPMKDKNAILNIIRNPLKFSHIAMQLYAMRRKLRWGNLVEVHWIT